MVSYKGRSANVTRQPKRLDRKSHWDPFFGVTLRAKLATTQPAGIEASDQETRKGFPGVFSSKQGAELRHPWDGPNPDVRLYIPLQKTEGVSPDRVFGPPSCTHSPRVWKNLSRADKEELVAEWGGAPKDDRSILPQGYWALLFDFHKAIRHHTSRASSIFPNRSPQNRITFRPTLRSKVPFSSLLICVWQFSACSVLHDAVSRISANTRHNSGIRSQLSVSNKLFVVTMFVVWWRTGPVTFPAAKQTGWFSNPASLGFKSSFGASSSVGWASGLN